MEAATAYDNTAYDNKQEQNIENGSPNYAISRADYQIQHSIDGSDVLSKGKTKEGFYTVKWFLLFLCCMVFVQSYLVSGYSSAILTTIETRYDLKSSQTGLIISVMDVMAMVSNIIVSYSGDNRNRARWLARGCLILSLGSAVITLPQFLGGTYSPKLHGNNSEMGDDLCHSEPPILPDCDVTDNLDNWSLGAFSPLAVFMIGFMLLGMGGSPIHSLGLTYLYDNCSREQYPMYSSIMYSMVALGPAAGFVLGGIFAGVWVDPWTEPPVGVTMASSEWVGAWWLGVVIVIGLAALVSIPLHMFPKVLPATKKLSHYQENESTKSTAGTQIKEFPKRLWQLMSNPTWLCISLVGVCEQAIATGFTRFIIKFLEVAYGLQTDSASFITGVVLIPSAVIGILAGGAMMKKLGLGLRGMVNFLMAMNIIPTIILCGIMTWNCHTRVVMGAPNSTDLYPGAETPVCNAGCLPCASPGNKVIYNPVCGYDQRIYYSPCMAGCQTIVQNEDNTTKLYKNCSCINDDFYITPPPKLPILYDDKPVADFLRMTWFSIMAPTDAVIRDDHMKRNFLTDTTTHDVFTDDVTAGDMTVGDAEPGNCAGCDKLVLMLALMFTIVFITSCGSAPLLLITLQSIRSSRTDEYSPMEDTDINDTNRSFALGMQNVLNQLLAWIPFPIVFGEIFDSVCLVWPPKDRCNEDDGGTGACQEYNTHTLVIYYIGLMLGLKVVSYIFMAFAWLASGMIRKEDKGVNKDGISQATTTSSVCSVSYTNTSGKPCVTMKNVVL